MQDPPPEDNAEDRTAEDHDTGKRGPALFEATLYPYRSLPWSGFRWLMTAVASLFLIRGGMLAAEGAWPVAIYFGLGFLLIYFAFRLNYRAGRLLETVRLTRDELLIRRIHPNGRVEEWRLQPTWVRVDAIPTSEALGAPVAEVRLSSHGRRLAIGRFLTDAERESFSEALRAALALARSAPHISS